MTFPWVAKQPGQAPPGARLYYEIASNGVFQVRETETYRAVTRVDGVPGLEPEHERVELKLPRVPRAIVEEILAFFDSVHRFHGGEAIVVLFFSPEAQAFRVGVPSQRITGYYDGRGVWWADYRLDYGDVARPEGFVRIGSVHSHARLAAYSSAVDCEDERFEDGLHIVFGDFGRARLSSSAAFVANGIRFRVEPEDAFEAAAVPPREGRADWLARVRREERSWGPTSALPSGGAVGG